MNELNEAPFDSSMLLVMLAVFLIFIIIELLAVYLHLAGFTLFEIVLLLAVPLFSYLAALPLVASASPASNGSTVSLFKEITRFIDLPLFHLGNTVIGINLVGFLIPAIISTKMILQKRIPHKETFLLVAIISVIAYLYTRFEPERGMVIYYCAIPSILAAGIAFMFKKRSGRSNHYNPALLSYAGATFGILIGADILNLYRALTHHWEESVFVSIGGGSVMDAIFLAGIVALGADVVFRSQEENIIGNLIKQFTGDRRR